MFKKLAEWNKTQEAQFMKWVAYKDADPYKDRETYFYAVMGIVTAIFVAWCW